MNFNKETFFKDFVASLVVFLVALPLCMGIAIASGVPPILGLLSGIIGGLIVGAFAGAPLQVSGPAAGLAVMVFQYVETYGVKALVPLGIIIGMVQLGAYYFKLGHYFKAISPALIKALLSGIGFLILASQLHVALDLKPLSNGLQNFITFPQRFLENVMMSSASREALMIASIAIAIMFGWSKIKAKFTKVIPGPLVGVIAASVISGLAGLNVQFVEIPKDILAELNIISAESFTMLSLSMIISAIAIAFVASAETLLCVSATDKMAKSDGSDYDKEMMAQGIGHIFAGMLGALPITGVIVRSSANIEAGGKTRVSAILHGVWLFVLVFMFPQVLELIPVSGLAAILIMTGVKLLDLKSIPKLIQKSKSEAMTFGITFALIVSVDLLTGVVVGFITSLFFMLHKLLNFEITHEHNDNEHVIRFKGKATFLHVPKINGALPMKAKKKVTLDLETMEYIDMAVEEQIEAWMEQLTDRGHKFEVKRPAPLRPSKVS